MWWSAYSSLALWQQKGGYSSPFWGSLQHLHSILGITPASRLHFWDHSSISTPFWGSLQHLHSILGITPALTSWLHLFWDLDNKRLLSLSKIVMPPLILRCPDCWICQHRLLRASTMDHGGRQHDRLAAESWLPSLHAVILLGGNKNAPLSLQGLTTSSRLVSNLLSPKYGDERLVPLQWTKDTLAISFNFIIS